MKKYGLRLICAMLSFILLTFTVTACFDTSGDGDPTDPHYVPVETAANKKLNADEFDPDRQKEEVSRQFCLAAADFALNLLESSRDSYEGDGHLVSPLSVMLALTMTANGAEGATREQMEEVLGGKLDVDELNEQLFNYCASLVSTDDARFNLANSIWVSMSESFEVNENFIKMVDNTYDADIIAVDMADPSLTESINAWVKKETFDMIDSIIDDGALDADTVMVLLNALAFDALWADQTDDYACSDDTFRGADGNTKVRYMYASCDGYIDGKDGCGIVKNYKGGNYAFVALLPDEGVSIDEYIASLDGKKFIDLFDDREKVSYNVEVNASIPFFSYDCKIDLGDVLSGMGMSDAFDSSAADFSALGRSALGNIYIDKVMHKTHIDLDNSGTRAAAVTSVTMIPESAGPMDLKKYYVELDRPFVYAIVDTATALPLFLGACENIAE